MPLKYIFIYIYKSLVFQLIPGISYISSEWTAICIIINNYRNRSRLNRTVEIDILENSQAEWTYNIVLNKDFAFASIQKKKAKYKTTKMKAKLGYSFHLKYTVLFIFYD